MIGLLNAYRTSADAPEYQLEYRAMFEKFWKTHFPKETLRVYDVAVDGLPKDIDECSAWIISGSSKSAFETDTWIVDLGHFVQRCFVQKKKLIGICFGHQLIAHYLDGKVEKSKKGWGVGVRNFKIVNNRPWMEPRLQNASLIFSHQDQVTKLPPFAVQLGEDDFCPNDMFSIGDSIFCMQGHPEYSVSFAKGRLDARLHLIGQTIYDKAISSLQIPTEAKVFASWMKQFIYNEV